ncbi:hypothetical protein LY76DRAFT_304597 [Colletotrichum caudatum]|nr:hypothetical protein LY76DRAFT_304597 [Colletotrichum caudatum]
MRSCFPLFSPLFFCLTCGKLPASRSRHADGQTDRKTRTHTYTHPQEDGPRLWVVMPGKGPVNMGRGGDDDDVDGPGETGRRDIHLSGYS